MSESHNGAAIILKDRAPALAHYPHGRIANGMIYVSGISSRRLDGTYEGVKENADGTLELDIKAQTKAVIENIKVILESQGASLKNIVDMTVFLTDMKDYGAMNQVYNTYFDAATGPSRTCVGVLTLPSPKLLIEIKAIALAPPTAADK
ncbi:2-aminomuconate deaminase [Entomortierella parvispora]|uniref:2-aminomuconate deaminase n=1 Tax=Entomortierella parvispora TaxID=205924 RepID=A0A9P3H4D3_9FUNG|nr:2-aminomuconate deaminase [Entomortierella parvispora]